MRLLIPLAFLCCVTTSGCLPDNCAPGPDAATLMLGQGVAEAFEPYASGQTVTIEPASQGGFGFPILIRTVGLLAGEDQDAAVVMDTVVSGETTGTWNQNTQLTCPDEQGGRTPSVLHVGFDSTVYATTDDFIDLQGESIDLVVTMTDTEGNTAAVTQSVVLALGG